MKRDRDDIFRVATIVDLMYLCAMFPEPSYITILAVACATACCMIAIMNVVMWIRSNRAHEHLLSAVMVTAAGCVSVIDLMQIQSTDIAAYVLMGRFMHVALFVMLISLVLFVRVYLGEGPRWLIGVIASMWALVMIPNYLAPAGVVHLQITELLHAEAPWGELYTIASGPINPWKYVADMATLVILVFIANASWAAWKKGQHQRVLVVGGSFAVFMLVAGGMAQLQDAGIVNFPLAIPLTFFVVIAALTYQLVDEAFKASAAALEIQQLRRAIALGEIVGGLAHEINQPLTAILSNAQAARRLLQSDEVDLQEIREIIDDIVEDDKRAGGIIQGLRQMLRRDNSGAMCTNIQEAVNATARLLKGELHTKDVTLELAVQTNIQTAQVDRVQFVEVLLNLILNGVRAVEKLPAERRRVTVGATEQDGSLLICVSDKGPGISGDQLAGLFEPFVSRSEDGLGIGLAVCRRIIERFGGKIWVEQNVGGGASFLFTLHSADAGRIS